MFLKERGYMAMAEENKWFDGKSSRIKPSDIYDLISAFANAEGGTIVEIYYIK
jgi:ATP-dependent DNA helicase RecG